MCVYLCLCVYLCVSLCVFCVSVCVFVFVCTSHLQRYVARGPRQPLSCGPGVCVRVCLCGYVCMCKSKCVRVFVMCVRGGSLDPDTRTMDLPVMAMAASPVVGVIRPLWAIRVC